MATREPGPEPAATAPLIRPRRARAAALLAGLALALSLAGSPAAEDGQTLEILETRHRLYDELRPLLEPLLAPGGTLTGSGSRLIVRTTPSNLVELRRAVAALDTRAQRLRISVSTSRIADGAFDAYALGARVDGAQGGVAVGTPPGGPGDEATARIARTQGRDEGTNLHSVLTLDGQTAFVDTGKANPQAWYSTQWGPYGGAAQAGVDYVEARSGFRVTPHLRGDQVEVEVAAQREDFARDGSGGLSIGGVDTRLSGPLGTWLPLGGTAQSTAGDQRAIVAHTRRRDNVQSGYWIRIDLVP
jgi:hypothetical protein